VSTDQEDQKNSFAAQQEFFLTQAAQLGYELSNDCGNNGIYADEGLSGKSRDKRDQFNQMIKDAQEGDFEWILTKDIKRFARDVVSLQDTVRELRRSKVYVYFIHENIKTNDFTEEVVMNILSALSQNDLQHLSKSIQFGMRQAQRDGKYTSQPPFGYDRVSAYLQINNNESAIVKDIFNMYVDKKMSLNKIVQFLNDNHISSKRGATWTSSAIRYILKNPIYTGLQINHKVECTDIYNNTVEIMDSAKWIQHQKEELRIIDNYTFETVQTELEERAKMYNQGQRYSTVNILSNILRCGNCGSTMKRFERTGSHTAFHMCRDHHNTKVCKFSNYVREDKMLEFIKEEFENFEFTWNAPGFPESIKELYEIYINDNLPDDLIDDLPSIEEKINELEEMKKRFSFQHAKGIITDNNLEAYVEEVKQELEPLLREKRKIDNLNSEKEKVWRKYDQFIKTIKEFNTTNFNNSDLRKIVKNIIVKTENNKKKYYIEWNNGLDKDFGKIAEEFADNRLIEIYGGEDFHDTYEFDK